MKNKLVYLFVAVMGLFVITSCDHNNPNHDKFEASPSKGYLHFVGEAPTITPSTDSLNLVIENSAPIYSKKDIKVSYDLVSVEGVDPNTLIHSATSTVTIPAGENSVPLDFEIDPDVQEQILESGEQIVFKIVLNTDDENIQADADVSSIELTYPCSIEPAASYEAQLSAPAIGFNPSDFGDYTVELTEVAENIYHTDNLFNPNWVGVMTGDDSNDGQFNYPATLIIDPTTLQVDVVDESGDLSSGGEGTYNPCKDTWSLDIHQTLFSGDPFDMHVDLKN